MNVFIAGATGVLGRRVVRQLVGKGFDIFGLSRSDQNAAWLENAGASPRSGDLFDADSLSAAVTGCDAVLHLVTAIPTKNRTSLKDWSLNDRIRREGTRNLVRAAAQKNCSLYVQQSVTLIYGNRAGDWVDETATIPDSHGGILQSAIDMEGIVHDAASESDLPTIVLRFGSFYAFDSAQTRAMFESARKGRFPVIGSGKVYWNVINVDDAASAVVSSIENHAGNTGETYNVCDDEPVTFVDLVEFVTKTLGAKRPLRIPRVLARLAIGSHTVDALMASVRCRNGKMKERLGWQPAYPTYRHGYTAEIENWQKEGRTQ